MVKMIVCVLVVIHRIRLGMNSANKHVKAVGVKDSLIVLSVSARRDTNLQEYLIIQ